MTSHLELARPVSLGDTLRSEPECGARDAAPAEVGPFLVRLLCADDLRSPSARYRIDDRTEVVLSRGRARGAHGQGGALAIELDDKYASGRHLRMVREERQWLATDQGSKNGTCVDGRRLAPGEPCALRDGALLELGHTFLLFRSGANGRADLPRVVEPRAAAPHEPPTLNPEWELELARIARLAPTRHELLLEGESGAGKEVLARLIHDGSGRRGPLVAVNCAALPENLLDDELFGHVRGAFSGAQGERPGLLRAAHEGTLFLDEVGDMPAPLQAKLLRVLEDGKVRPIGAERDVEVDVRFLAATHRDLRALVAEGTFRHDLLARVGLLTFRVPALRERREDLGLLIRGILGAREDVRFEISALRALLLYPWPLNVRELRRVLLAAVDLAPADEGGARVLALEHLPAALREQAPRAKAAGGPRRALTPEEEALRERIGDALRRHGGNVAAVARELGRPRTQVQRQMARLGLEREPSADPAENPAG